ncbi:MAG: hypothetical protein ACMZ66_06865 [Thalassospira sp.]|uniref:hypothetical protein n=1 Tax=Thalassospira sp. TaxID=1912094 RepID=UPI003A8596B1
MAKTLVLAVAGAGKTKLLIDKLNDKDRFLVLTYTNNNQNSLRARIIERFGCVPPNITVSGYFEFLYGFCLRPLLGEDIECKGVNWNFPPVSNRRFGRDKIEHYFDDNGFVYHNRMALLANDNKDVKARIEKYYDVLLIDEAQDFGGHDLNFICSFPQMNVEVLLVGDFYQHTFDTSRDGATNGTIYNDYLKYTSKLEKSGYTLDKDTLVKSHRCSSETCAYIRDNLQIRIESHRDDVTNIITVKTQEKADELFHDVNVVKLFYQNSAKYPCYSDNWGNSKGQDHYNDVCVVLNPATFKLFEAEELHELNPKTKGKLYVACTRARGDIFFVPEKYYTKYKSST